MPSLTTLIPILGIWVVIGIGWVVKILLERQTNSKKAEHHVYAQKWPTAGYMTGELIPIETIGGMECVRYPRKGEASKWPIHRLSDAAQVPMLWPPGKIHFVQASVQAIMFLGDDVEPLSNIRNMPPISAQQLGSLIQGVTTATDETIKRINDEANEGKIKKAGALLWVYVCFGVLGALVITNIVLNVTGNGNISDMAKTMLKGINDLLAARGLR